MGYLTAEPALWLFVFLGLFSPGPNVILLTASGARFGLRRTVPHILGVAVGVGVIAAAAGAGVSVILLEFPALDLVLRVAAFCWILWLAYGLLQRKRARAGTGAKPFTVLQAALFQWVNPKVWAVAMAAAAGYGHGQGPGAEAARLALVFTSLNLGVCLFWTAAGGLLSFLLTTPRAWRVFNATMAIFLALSATAVFL